MTSQEQGQLRNDAEALVKASAWLARRAELLLANVRDGRLGTLGTDAMSGIIEADYILDRFTDIARKAGVPLPDEKEGAQ